MELLKERIRREGVNMGHGILKVDSFINHQVDPALMLAVGGALAARFAHLGANKIVTAEISGIAPGADDRAWRWASRSSTPARPSRSPCTRTP